MATVPPLDSLTRPAWLDERMQSLMDRAIAREKALSAVLMTYIVSGLVFLLLPGTFLGVWNLISISRLQAAEKISPGWIQAHGHAQIFGWVATFILGIGFYSIPKLRKMKPFPLWRAWVCWSVWTAGVLLRWAMTIWPWHWRVAFPLSAALELGAFLLFFLTIGPAHSSSDGAAKKSWDPWIYAVLLGTSGLLLALVLQLSESVRLSLTASSSSFPAGFDQRYLAVLAWAFLAPFVWGFSARWLPVFAGLRPTKSNLFLSGVVFDLCGVCAALAGAFRLATIFFAIGATAATLALRFLEPSQSKPKVAGIHPSFAVFVRLAYVWLLIAAALGVWAAFHGQDSTGIWGASRHALTVGFVAAMVFSVGQRVLPSFCGMRVLASRTLMFVCLLLLMIGCTLRVSSEVVAYQGYGNWAWRILPISAVVEMTAVTLFAVNLIWTFLRPPIVAPNPLQMYVE